MEFNSVVYLTVQISLGISRKLITKIISKIKIHILSNFIVLWCIIILDIYLLFALSYATLSFVVKLMPKHIL